MRGPDRSEKGKRDLLQLKVSAQTLDFLARLTIVMKLYIPNHSQFPLRSHCSFDGLFRV